MLEFLRDLTKNADKFLGILCFLIFSLNAVLLVWLLVRKSTHGLAKCPKCGRQIACPHCTDDEDES